MEKAVKYQPLSGDLHGDDWSEDNLFEKPRRQSSDWTRRALILSNIVLFAVVVLLSTVIIEPSWFPLRINADLKRVSYYNPLLNELEIPVEDVIHDNTLFAHSAYAQPPSPEVDEIWANLSHPRIYLVDDETIRRIGKDPEYTVQHPDYPGQHITYLAVHHQLHCLNDLRRNVFADHYFPNGVAGTHVDHLQHCIDLLRQTLTCNANLDLITYNWWELTGNPQPDFHVNMKCRNWDVVDEYLARPFEETGIFKWYEHGWEEGWARQGGEKNVTIDKKWWEIALKGGEVTPEEFRARWGAIPVQ